MNQPKKPLHKRIWIYIFGLITIGLISLFLIPYGLNNKSIGSQLVDTAEQFTALNIYDEKEQWNDDEWNEYWDEHPEFLSDSSGIDWDTFPSGTGIDDSRLEALPPDYSKLWDIDFSNLETIERYNTYENKPVLDSKGNPVMEEFIYKDKTTGEYIVDLTLDGFILRLDPSYSVGWNHHSKTDPNGFNKYKKAQNLKLFKKVEGEECWIQIDPHEWNTITNDKVIEHPEYQITMGYNAELHSEEKPRRTLKLELDEAPYNTDIYSIEIISPQIECFSVNLEMEIVEGMTFLPPELKGGPGPDYDELNAFPIPYYWPNPLNEGVKITVDETTKEQVIEYNGFRFKAKLEWRIESTGESALKISSSRRCKTYINNWNDWPIFLKESGAENFNEYFKMSEKNEESHEWGIKEEIQKNENLTSNSIEINKGINTTILDDGERLSYGSYTIKQGDLVRRINWTIENEFEDVLNQECDFLSQYIFDSFEFL